MLDSDTKRRIDTARDILVGKVPDPKSQVEQITISLIYKFMDDMDKEVEELEGKPSFFQGEFTKYSWSRIFDPRISGFELVTLYGEAIDKMNLNPNIPQLFRDIFKNAYLPYRDPETLKSFLKIINEFHYSHSEKLGDAYEYLLSILSSQGDAGQFRTPRHMIDFMVEVVSPQKSDKVLDPALGTAGFLISSYKQILKDNTNEKSGDKLTPEDRNNLIKNFSGYDISPDMVRISLVNMYLHGFSNPRIYEYDTLTSEDRWNEFYDIILANPPFMSPKGGIKPHKRFSIQANRSEVLFVDYICEHLTPTGKAGVIVPEGIIFQSGNAYKQLRKMLVENYLWAVVSLPAGVFNPYSGVKTSILFIDKQLNKKSDNILFVKIENDGHDLGAQRREIDKNDLPDALQILKEYKTNLVIPAEAGIQDIKNNVLLVPKEKIAIKEDYNLSIDRHRVDENIQQSNFEMVRLGDIMIFEYGKPLKEENRKEGQYPVFGSNGIVGFHNEYLVTAPFIIIGRKGTAGAVNYSEKNGYPIDTTFYIKLKDNNRIILKFAYYILKSLGLDKINVQSGVPGLNRNDAYEKMFPLPPLSVQQEIVNKIKGYQSIINGARQVVDNYKPQIDINPEWKMVELGEVITLQRGYDLPKQNWIEGEYPIVGSNGIIGFHNSYKEKGPGVVTGRSGTIGKVHYIDYDFYWPHNTSLFVKDFKGNNPAYIKILLESLDLKSLGERTSAVPSLDRKNAHLLKIYIPPVQVQQQIVSRIEQEQKLIKANKELIKLYEQKINDEIEKVWKK